MIRIRFDSDQDRVQGNLLLLQSFRSHRLPGNIFVIEPEDRKVLDAHGLRYTVLPVVNSKVLQYVLISLGAAILLACVSALTSLVIGRPITLSDILSACYGGLLVVSLVPWWWSNGERPKPKNE